ncbi:hypothetical protein [Microbulbifer aggregans]|uniref:hypothetical protein n=1 Tax=Microbulbifer aggregans TaxID=1769779 RepID=UPI001CFC73E3|nr:hypothetical protein [Microbulbifer aggregans]
MKTKLFLLILVALSGCSTNPAIDRTENGVLVNGREKTDGGVSLIFASVDGKRLRPGPWTAPIEAIFPVSPGKRDIGIRVVFTPEKTTAQKVGFQNTFHYVLESNTELWAETGKSYVLKAKRSGSLATFWIESESGNKESEVKTGSVEKVTIVPVVY